MKAAALAFAVLNLWSCGGGSTSTGTSVAVADGRHFGYIRSASAASLQVDLAEFLTGKAANDAAVAAGEIQPGEQVPNDYFVSNPDPSVATLPVAASVTVTRVGCRTSCRQGLPGNYAELLASFANPTYSLAAAYRGPNSQYWLTTRNGRVVRIDEQYVP